MFPSGSYCRKTFHLYSERMNLAARILMKLVLAMANGLQSVSELVSEVETATGLKKQLAMKQGSVILMTANLKYTLL